MPHSFLVHFPVALLVASFVFDLLGRFKGREGLRHAGFYTLIGGVVGAALAVPTGFLAADGMISRIMERAGPEAAEPVIQVISLHRALALATLAVSILLLVWRINLKNDLSGGRYGAYVVAAFLAASLVLGTGYVGGEQIRQAMFRDGRGGAFPGAPPGGGEFRPGGAGAFEPGAAMGTGGAAGLGFDRGFDGGASR